MTFEEVYATLPDGWLTEPEARLLWDTAQKAEGPILECGAYKGRSTVLLACTGRHVYTVDPFDGFDSDLTGKEVETIFWNNLKGRGLHNVLLFRCRIETWGPLKVGFAYLDGEHTYKGTQAQIEKALQCLTTSPHYIGLHDVNDSGQGTEVKRAALEILGPWAERTERLAIWGPR